MKKKTITKAIVLGLSASFFSTSTYLINDYLSAAGSSWLWSVALRYSLVFLFLSVYFILSKRIKTIFLVLKQDLTKWLLWSSVAFSVFYSGLTLASHYAPSWLVASSYQITMFAGVVITPFFSNKEMDETNSSEPYTRFRMPSKLLYGFTIIFIGVFLCNFPGTNAFQSVNSLKFILFILVAAFAYPLGNRKVMALAKNRLSTIERIYGMALSNLPMSFLFAITGGLLHGPPGKSQVLQAGIIAISSGIIATLLYFTATELVKSNATFLALVESTQVGEIVFSLIGGVYLLGNALPNNIQWIGVLLIFIGMGVNVLVSSTTTKPAWTQSPE